MTSRVELLRSLPLFLKAWIAIEVVAFVVGPVLNPNPRSFPILVGQLLFWGGIAFLLARGMSARSRGAWIGALLWAAVQLVAGIGIVRSALGGGSVDLAWGVWGGTASFAQIIALLSPGARAWMRGEKEDRA
ncbi:MAG: hypothetical protein LC808_30240 [Actinobacteria bacterium]|nr:hypothetical protein [Actinomycetota bacterium]